MYSCPRLLLFVLLLLGGVGLTACPRHQPPPGTAPVRTAPLPAPLARLLAPRLSAALPASADVARLRLARPVWAADSLGRLLVGSRLGADFHTLREPDSSLRYLRQAWRSAGPAQRQRQPAEVVSLAHELADRYYERAAYDSARRYFQLAARVFRAAGLDSSGRGPDVLLPSTHVFAAGNALPALVAGAGLASRRLGDLPTALRYYEQAEALYRRQTNLSGAIWAQGLVGEAYAEQGDEQRAARAYEQALASARVYARQAPNGAGTLAGLLLEYYLPLLLANPQQWPYARALVEESVRILQQPAPPGKSRFKVTHDAVQGAHLQLVPAEIALRQGRPADAAPALAAADQWLAQAAALGRRSGEQDENYPAVQALAWGLRAWQQHARRPPAARQLMRRATALLTDGSRVSSQARSRRQLAGYCLAMGEPTQAVLLLRPLLRLYQQPRSPLPLSQVTELLAQAYAQAGRYDSAFLYARRTQFLTDTVRATRQFAALAATEARFRTREQAGQIRQLTEHGRQQTLRARLAAAGAVLLALLLLVAALAWRTGRRLNRQLAAEAEHLNRLDAAKNQFFANVSHELRTPLTLVLGPLETLLAAPARALAPAARGSVAVAHRHARRLQELVNRILDLTKLQAGRLELLPVPTALGALLRRMVGQFEALAAERRIALVAPPAPPAEIYLLLDAGKVEEILTNLLINALNHTPAGGAVTVSAALPAPDGQYAVTVRDTGPGIAPAEQTRVFERFYQSPQGQAQGGTGLGLALSRELATLLGGTLTLASEPGQGAAFTLRFPAKVVELNELGVRSDALRVEEIGAELHADGEAFAIRAGETRPGIAAGLAAPDTTLSTTDYQLIIAKSKPRVLVVEDEPDLREYLRQLLAPTCEVLLAEDGQAALELLAHAAPVDFIITDAMMPRLSGTELLARLKANPAQRGIPVLMLTARADDAHRLEALAVGVDDYLTKPFGAAELLAGTRALLARHTVRRYYAAQPAEEAPLNVPTAPPTTANFPVTAEAPLPVADDSAAAQLAQWQAWVAPALTDPAFGPAQLAELLLLSERTLYRRLGEMAGLTPAAWLRELRLNHARRLLEAGGFGTVAAVAEAAGFANAKSFGQRYAERFGRLPSTYRS